MNTLKRYYVNLYKRLEGGDTRAITEFVLLIISCSMTTMALGIILVLMILKFIL